MYDDFCLRADTEAELVAALPWFRDAGRWIETDGRRAALDVIGPMWLAAPTVQGGEPTVDERFHANLRLPSGHPDRSAILAAVAPYRIIPAAPRRTFF